MGVCIYRNAIFLELGKIIFDICWLPGGAERAGHAHKQLQQLIVAIGGSFDVHLDDGFEKKTVRLNRASSGLYVCPMIYRTIDNFSSGSTCLVLASEHYDEDDYYRNYDEFLAAARDVTPG